MASAGEDTCGASWGRTRQHWRGGCGGHPRGRTWGQALAREGTGPGPGGGMQPALGLGHGARPWGVRAAGPGECAQPALGGARGQHRGVRAAGPGDRGTGPSPGGCARPARGAAPRQAHLVGVPQAHGAAQGQLPRQQVVHPAEGELQVPHLVLTQVPVHLLCGDKQAPRVSRAPPGNPLHPPERLPPEPGRAGPCCSESGTTPRGAQRRAGAAVT